MATTVNKNKTASKDKGKKKWRMPHSFTLLFGIIVIAMVMSWIAPSGYYVDDIYFSAGRVQQGIVQGFMALGKGFIDAGSLIFFLFGLGAMLHIVVKSEAMEAAVGPMLKKLEGKEVYIIPIMMLFFGLGGTIYGMQEETLAFYAILVPIFTLAGFDAMTGFMVVMVGSTLGFSASTINPFSIGAAVDAANGTSAGEIVNIGQGLAFRWFSWAIIMATGISFVTWYGLRVQKDKTKSVFTKEELKANEKWAKQNYDLAKLPKFNKTRVITLSIFFGFLLWMVLVFIPWDDLGVTAFATLSDRIANNAAWIDNSGEWTIGWWYFLEVGVLAFILAFILGMVNKHGEKNTYELMGEGASGMMNVAFVIALARGVSVILGGSEGAIFIAPVDGVEPLKFELLDWNETAIASWTEEGGWQGLLSNSRENEVLVLFLNENTTQIGDNIFFGDMNSASVEYGVTASLNNSLLNSMSGVRNMPELLFAPMIYLMYLPLSFLVPSTSGLASATMGVVGPMADSVGDGMVPQAITAYSLAIGVVNLVTPTQGVVVGALAISRIEYGKYLKTILPLFAIVVLVSVILMVIAGTPFGAI